MSRTYKRSHRFARDVYLILLKGNPLIPLEHRITRANDAISIANPSRDMRDLVSVRLSFSDRASEASERLSEKRGNEMRLQATRLCAVHLLLDFLNSAEAKRFVSEGTLFD